jgi:hypothetical protein
MILCLLDELDRARDLDQDTLERRRRTLGDDHPDTLASADNLASDLRELGEYEQARELDRDALDRRRGTLGDEHPDTHRSARNLAADLKGLGDTERSAALLAEFGLAPD